jgi:EAL domain-containing protein (putative c-di-GMP-specific phosphodiesterase class I)
MNHRIQQLLEAGGVGAEYQPLLDVWSLEIRAYEALVRVWVGGGLYPNEEMFRLLQQDRVAFFQLERRFKEFQIRHRPPGAPLFVNLDPSLCVSPCQLAHWAESLGEGPGLTVEIIENTGTADQSAVDALTQTLRAKKIGVALDDLGSPRTLLSLEMLARADVLKLDRAWLLRARQSVAYRRLLDGFIGFAQEAKVRTVLEGVETEADLSFARALGIDMVQGFLFREHFVQALPE